MLESYNISPGLLKKNFALTESWENEMLRIDVGAWCSGSILPLNRD